MAEHQVDPDRLRQLMMTWVMNLEYRLTKLERADMDGDIDGYALRQAHSVMIAMMMSWGPQPPKKLTAEEIKDMTREMDELTRLWQRNITNFQDPNE